MCCCCPSKSKSGGCKTLQLKQNGTSNLFKGELCRTDVIHPAK